MQTRASRDASHQRRVIVVEIAGDWLKVIEFERSHRGLVVSRLGLERFATLDNSLAEAISRLRTSLKLGTGPVVVSLPRHVVTTRMIELPSTDPDEIADMVDLQAAKQTHYSKTEVVFDHRRLESAREGYSRVLLGIVQRHVAEERFYLVEKGGFTVGRMAVSTEGLLAWYREAVRGETASGGVDILLDVDSTHSEFLVMAGGDLLFTRSISIGATQLLAAAQTVGDKLAMEIRVALDVFRGERPDVTPKRIILSGAAPNIRGLDAQLGSSLGIPTEIRNSLAAVRSWPPAPSLQAEQYRVISLTALVGMGLAPQTLQFNLVPESVSLKRNLAHKATSLTNFAALLMTLLFCISGIATANLCFRRAVLGGLREKRRATEPVAERVQRMIELIKLVRERRDTKYTPLSILGELAGAVPRGEVVFDTVRIDCEKRQVVLQGMATSRGVVGTLVQNLRKSPVFADDVKEAGPTTADRSGRFRFLINAGLEREP